MTAATSNGTRVAVIAGCRTPFAKAGTVYRDLTAVDLARICVRELVERAEVDPAWIDTVVMGQVIPSVRAPNLAREVVLGTGLPAGHPRPHREPRLRVRERGHRGGGVGDPARATSRPASAGGAESLSDVPILHSRRMAQTLVEASRARSLAERLAAFAKSARRT